MNLWELFLIAAGLSMDAFAVSVCKGLATKKIEIRHFLIVGLWFGGFQALMPALGYFLGSGFEQYISHLDHWIAFILLALIGGNMIREALSKNEECHDASFSVKTMFIMAVATSIDALTVGITFAFLKVQIVPAVSLIGVTTFVLSAAGLWIGNVFGSRYKARAEFFGGIVLILMGTKILLEHLGVMG